MNTAIMAGLSRTDRQRIADRIAELRELDRLMRQPGTLAAPHGHDDTTTERTAP